MSTMKYDMQDADFIDSLQTAGHPCQSSIFPTPHECRSLHDGVAIELSDFFWHQTVGRTPSASVSEILNLVAGESWQSPSLEAGEFSAEQPVSDGGAAVAGGAADGGNVQHLRPGLQGGLIITAQPGFRQGRRQKPDLVATGFSQII